MRFNHFFYFLLLLSGLCAFVVPARFVDAARPKVSILFVPVASPSRALAAWATGRFSGPAVRLDHRPPDAIYQENEELKSATIRLAYELAELRKLKLDRDKLGIISDLCTPVKVVGSDLGARESLALRSGSLSGLADGMYVLYDQDVVGTLITGKAGAQVRLITDPQSKVNAYFVTFRKVARSATRPAVSGDGTPVEPPFTRLNLPTKLVEGAGKGRMICRNIPYADVEAQQLKINDWALVDDPEWPRTLQRRRLGMVTDIKKTSRMMAEIEIKPEADLLRLSEVMVLTKDQ